MRNLKNALLVLLLTFVLPANLTQSFQKTQPSAAEIPTAFEQDETLQAEANALLSLFDNMPSVPVYLKNEPILKAGTNTETALAYTHCYSQESPSIFVKKAFYQNNNKKWLTNVLKHELTHAWLCRQRLMSVGHDDNFRRKFSQIGGFGN